MKKSFALPEISPVWLRFFSRYATSYLRRHFHSIRLLGPAPPNDFTGPLVVYLNHAAWWDPLVCLFLARHFFPKRNCYAPMAAAALSRYRFFQRLGFFPVETGTARGAAQFLHNSKAILEQPGSALFLTPQGKFADVRAPLQFAPGIEHLATRVAQARFLPLAIEYPFWEERKPEILFGFGESGSNGLSDRLAAVQAKLAAAAQRRQPNEWTILLKSKSGASRPYDLWRWLRGEAFAPDHSSL